ncbi:hypothetical protein HDU84_006849 [Entophlyctis sp. JEL0112]|nr:hypothetical protein HDU84_006849 [Entophlyctis sp. JEL0112]
MLSSFVIPFSDYLFKSAPHLHDLLKSLQSLPSGLQLSLNAHTSLTLATIVESLSAPGQKQCRRDSSTSDSSSGKYNAHAAETFLFDVQRVGGSLRELSGALNAAADGIVAVRSDGVFCVRTIVRVWDSSLGRLERLVIDDGMAITSAGRGRTEEPDHPQRSHQEQRKCDERSSKRLINFFESTLEALLGVSSRKKKVVDLLQERQHIAHHLVSRIADVLEETDTLLQSLETSIFLVLERMSVVHAIWQGANGVAHRERLKILSIAQELRFELDEMKNQQENSSKDWARKLAKWVLQSNSAGMEGRSTGRVTERMLQRLEEDMVLLGKVVSNLNDVAPEVVGIGHQVKQMRAGVQRFRADLKSGAVLEGGMGWIDTRENYQLDFGRMRVLLGVLADAAQRGLSL